MSETRRSLLAYLAAMIGCASLLAVLLQLGRADLRVPFAYGGDAVCAQVWAKGVAENGWYLTNPSLGLPARMEMHDFPLADGLFFLMLRGFAVAAGDHVVALNAFYLATYFLATATALGSLRRLGVARGPAVACALLYAFLPYHFFRGESHPFLASYFLVPPAALLALQLYRDGAIPRRRRAMAVGLCLLLGSGGIYYAAFSCALLMVAGGCAAIARRGLRPLVEAAILAGAIVAAGVVNLAPTLLYRLKHGPNPAAVVRFPVHTELWGLRITQLLLPVQGHRIEALAGLRRKYDLAQAWPPWDSDASTLGVVGAIGFLGLLVVALARRGAASPRVVDGLATLNLAALLIATTSGLGATFGYVVSPMIRCYNRMSVFIAFFALAAVGLALSRLVASARPGWPRAASYAGLAAVLVVGVLDETPRRVAPDYAALKAAYARDAEFVARIEATLPPGSAVFQLPVLDFPEAIAPGAMVAYDHGRAYLHSKTLRWSFGAMKGRFGDAWQHAAADQPAPAMLRSLALAGFAGVYVDRLGFDDRGAGLEAGLAREAGTPTIESADRRLAFYDLRPFATALRDRLGPAGWAEARARAIDGVATTWLGGFLARLDGPDGDASRVCGPRGRLRLDNPSSLPRRVEVALALRRLAPATGPVRIDWPDGAASYPSDGPVRRSLVVPPGGLTVLFSIPGADALAPEAPAFVVERFDVAEPGATPGRLAGGSDPAARR